MTTTELSDHVSDLLPAHVNRSLSAPERVAVMRHLTGCPRCAGESAEWAAIATALHAVEAAHGTPSRGVLDRVWLKIEEAPRARWRGLLRRQLLVGQRRAAAAVGAGALAAALAGGVFLMGNGSGHVLKPFQPQPAAVAPALEPLSSLSQLSDYGTVSDSGEPRPQDVPNAAAAAALAGMNVLTPGFLPATITDPPAYSVVSGSDTTFTLSVAKARAAAASHGGTLPALPPDMDGAGLDVTLHSGVLAIYGGGVEDHRASESGGQAPAPPPLAIARAPQLIIGQVSRPTLSSTGAPVDRIEQYLLSQPGISPQLAAALKALADPGSDAGTLALTMLPVPLAGVSAQAQSVSVQGVNGLAINDGSDVGGAILWQKDGVVFVVAGALGEKDLSGVANSLR